MQAYLGTAPCLTIADAAAPARLPRRSPLLAVRDLNAWYGESHVLHGVDFDVAAGEVVTLLGRNGAGKTTTLKSIMGVVPRREGIGRVRGHRDRAPCRRTGSRGSASRWCPEERGIFASLNVEENLMLPPHGARGRPYRRADLRALPQPARSACASQGTKLSGGEQQMLAIGRILRTGAQLLLLDEPTEGLAPVIVQQIGRTIGASEGAGLHDPAGRAEFPLRGDRRGPALRRWTTAASST